MDLAKNAFLALLSNDIEERPQAVAPMSDETVERLRMRTAGVEVEPEGDFAKASSL